MASQDEFRIDIAPEYKEPFTTTSENVAKHPEQVFNGADIAWTMTSSLLVMLMIAGISLLHSGLSDRRSAISMFRLPILTTVVVGCQWYLFGYSLAFSARSTEDGWTFWGGTTKSVFDNVLTTPVGINPGPRIPEVVYALFQEMFACFTACIVSGAAYRKVPTIQFLLFIFIWTTVVYDPIARWSWHEQGWSKRRYSLDFAGGTVVHITSGAAVQAFAVWYGMKVWLIGRLSKEQRRERRNAHLTKETPHGPHNITFVVLGTTLMWIGWFGFNGGSALGANARAASACMSTQIAACFGAATGLAWYALLKLGTSDQSATIFFCDGALNGLVAITPAAGYVPPKLAPIFGVVAASAIVIVESVLELLLLNFPNSPLLDTVFMQYDLLHVGIVHAGSGLVGMFLTAFFNRPEIFELDGFSTALGYSQGAEQLRHQLFDAAAAWLYSFSVTLSLLWLSTGIKWLISVLGLGSGPWDEEKRLAVLDKHSWAVGEMQVSGADFERSLVPEPAATTTSREVPAVGENFEFSLYGARANGRNVPPVLAPSSDSSA